LTALPRFDVTVVGELNLDLILYGLPRDLPPEREILANQLKLTLGSSSAIFAHNLAALGARVGFISRIADDSLGGISLERLRASGADVSKVKKVSGPTATGLTVILQHPDGRNILTYPGAMFEMCFEDLDLDYLVSSRHFHLSSFFLHRALLPRIPALFAKMKDAGLTTSLDINDDPDDRWNSGVWEALRFVDIFFLNERELKKLTGSADLDSGVERVAQQVPLLVVKLGAGGALLRHRGQELRKPAVRVPVMDLVGAGDSFDAGFVYQFLHGSDLPACLEYANITGALCATRPGGTEAFREPEYLSSFLARHWRLNAGVEVH
jgi:sugar/nucleoside kinase (ribokinase family)